MLGHYVWHWPTLTHHWPNISRFINRRATHPPPHPRDVVPASSWSEYSCPGHKVIIPILCIYQSIAGSNVNIGVCYCQYKIEGRSTMDRVWRFEIVAACRVVPPPPHLGRCRTTCLLIRKFIAIIPILRIFQIYCWNEWSFRPPVHIEAKLGQEKPEYVQLNEMILLSRHKIRNLTLGGLRPSTLPLCHWGSPQYWIFKYCESEKETFCFLKLEGQRGVRTRDLRLSKQAALTTAPEPPYIYCWKEWQHWCMLVSINHKRDVVQWLVWHFAIVAACRTCSKPTWVGFQINISCFSLLNVGTLFRCMWPWAKYFTMTCFTRPMCKWVGPREMAMCKIPLMRRPDSSWS